MDLTLSARTITGEVPLIQARTRPVTSVIVPHFEYFYAKERPSVARALRLTLRDDQLAEEATDEAMTRAYERWGQVSSLESPGGWVYRVGLNWALSVLRRARRKRRPADELGYAELADSPDASLRRALERLDVNHRAVVICRYYLDYSEAETATALKIRPGTAKSRLHRALREMHVQLAPGRMQ
jgi:RNA polymerase sigma factor (sigma-70 family)